MAVLRIGKEFLLDYGKLDRPLQVKISEVFGRFADATHTGIHLEKSTPPAIRGTGPFGSTTSGAASCWPRNRAVPTCCCEFCPTTTPTPGPVGTN
ncbi:hypothetical protein NWFMUON74_52740 [Nocardia wallacei]|uniref:Uncharacterized protein n=1 Tax=Nocardia wallacei TaxID=480035 RepID=A0A7G1KQR3_9NOCA|nr:hypothetical protein NWFMUON74_52740 [Nocardia wallacei]